VTSLASTKGFRGSGRAAASAFPATASLRQLLGRLAKNDGDAGAALSLTRALSTEIVWPPSTPPLPSFLEATLGAK
jgi:hypothetical protein